MQELNSLNEGDELHITLEDGKKVPLTVAGTDKHNAWLNYDGQEYAKLHDPAGGEGLVLLTLYTEEVGRHSVDNVEEV